MAREAVPWVCVTGASGDVGEGVLRGLGLGDPRPRVLALDWQADCPAFPAADAGRQVPGYDHDNYVEALCSAIEEVGAKLLFPGIDGEIPKLARHRGEIADRTGCEVVVAAPELVEVATDKLLASSWLTDLGVGSPLTMDGAATVAELAVGVGFPMVAKPRRGHASQGIVRIDDERALVDFLRRGATDYCYQTFVDGPEFTIGLLFDRGGDLVDALTMRRELEGGRTVRADVESHPRIDAAIEAFAAGSGATGPINMQLRLDAESNAAVFEVNPRLSGSTALRVALGFNDPLRIYQERVLGEPMRPAPVERGTRVSRVAGEIVVERPAR